MIGESIFPLWQKVKHKEEYLNYGQPLYTKKAFGPHIWDDKGIRYTDFLMGWGSSLFGYGDPEFVELVRRHSVDFYALNNHSEIEMSLAKKLISWYESPMQVAYFLNGSDATSLALRIARAHTGRHTIFSCGYHGWQDWSQPESSGVLLYERKYSKKFNYGEVSSLVSEIEIKKNEVAVVMLETPFPSNFIKEIKQICKIAKEANVLIAFDEVKAGGRVGFTSGQDSSGVEPDFALYGKVFGGGLPLSFMLVKKILAQKVPNDTFLSSTFWGYPLALNMADAVVDRINSSDELTILKKRADKFIKNINHFTTTHHIPLMFYGESLMPSLQIDEKYSHAFYTACFAHGLYIRPNHCWFLSVAHTDAVLDESYELLQSVIKKVFTI